MTVIVTTHSEQEEKELLAFLKCKKLSFSTDKTTILTEEQKAEILRRDKNFLAGNSSAENWDDVKAELLSVYR